MAVSAKRWLDRIHVLKFDRPIKIMNICGGKEPSITQTGLPAEVRAGLSRGGR